MDDVIVYSEGLFYMSVCAPGDMSQSSVVQEINREHPSGTEAGWRVSEDATFATGQPHPAPCDQDSKRTHWLLVA